MRNKRIVSYLVAAAMGAGLLLPGNIASAKEDVSAETRGVQETIVQSLIPGFP